MASKRPTKMWQAERKFRTGKKDSKKKKDNLWKKMVKKIQRIQMIARELKKNRKEEIAVLWNLRISQLSKKHPRHKKTRTFTKYIHTGTHTDRYIHIHDKNIGFRYAIFIVKSVR